MISRDDRQFERRVPREPGVPDLDDMLRGDVTPDLTESIMGQLGYRRVDGAEKHRALRRRWLSRAAVACSALAAVLIGVQVHQMSGDVRSVRGVTIDAAISRDLGPSLNAVGDVSRSVRQLLTPAGLPGAPSPGVVPADLREAAEDDDEVGYRSRVPWSGLL